MARKRYLTFLPVLLLVIGSLTGSSTAFAKDLPTPIETGPGYAIYEKGPDKEEYYSCFRGYLCFDWSATKHVEFYQCGVFPVQGWVGNIERVFNHQVGGRGFAVWYDKNMNHIGVLNNGAERRNVWANPIYYVSPC